ncbi:MAG TPA: polysaccharide deacetylase family protein, partial [Devosia sp.]|nr:polysaccharide deacetylase family protein [Devosia sp.]
LGGCAKPPASRPSMASSYVASAPVPSGPVQQAAFAAPAHRAVLRDRIFAPGHLGGRTLAVASNADIALAPGEVILTFDDGPRPGRTDAILDTLDQYGVKATFMMLGSAATAHPGLVRTVAARGHTIGNHSYDHANLSSMTRQAALDDVLKGERAITRALAGSGQALAPFFRFPYLAQTGFLRTNMRQSGMVILDVDVDSKDYYAETPAQVAARTLSRLEARGSGIILFHDIHARTVAMLPEFLQQLEDRGYSVVRLVPRDPGVFGRDIITAEAPDGESTF